MNEATRIIDVTNLVGIVIAPDWLSSAERVHRQLRTGLPQDYSGTMLRVFEGGGRMCVATRNDAVVGVAVYRIYENTFDGVQMYVDDLVTDEAARSSGVGKELLEYLQKRARTVGCASFNLDSGTQRHRSHRFYFREEMVVIGFHFTKSLK